MSKHSRFVFLSAVLLFTLFLSLTCPVTVSAEDGAPPPATEEPLQPPTEERGEPEANPEEAEPVATETPVATQIPGESADGLLPIIENKEASEELTVGEILEAAPESTEVVVLDENGQALPLVSAEAAQIVQSGDPIWCPAGASPMALAAGCTASYSSLADLLNFLITFQADPNYDQAGVIWIRNDYNSSSAEAAGVTQFVMQGGASNPFAHMSPYTLTIQGGWTGDNAGTINHGDPSTFAGDALQIVNWGGDVTINDVEFLNTGATGLLVETQGDITLSNVDANGNSATGADLDSGGNIDIRSSTFGAGAASGNGLFGLNTTAVGSTTLVDAVASGNGIAGAMLGGPVDSGGAVTVNESHFDGNGAFGLAAFSGNSIILSNVTASDNAGVGIPLAGANLIGDGPITVIESHFDRNGFGGLMASSGSEVALAFVTANGNAFFGANVDAADSVWVSQSYFDGNLGEAIGLGVISDQTITLDHVSASNNEGNGVLLDSLGDAAIICSGFNGNRGIGVDGFLVDGTFTLNDVTFGKNGQNYDGTPVFMSGDCTITMGGSGHGNEASHSLPLHIVPVSGGEQIELNCSSYSGTKLILPSGDNAILYCPVLEDAYLTSLTLHGLSTMPDGFTFVSGMEVKVTRGEEVRTSVGHNVVVSFVVPDDKIGSSFTILHWDGSTWNELGGSYTDGYFSVETSVVGVFVLAIK